MYYRIATSKDSKVTGLVDTQSALSVTPPNYSFDTRHIAYHYYSYIGPTDDVVIPQPILEARAKLTDLVSTVEFGFDLIMSPKLKSILEPVRHNGSQFIPLTLYAKAVPMDYWLLHMVEPDMDELDYEKSEFEITTNTGRSLRPVSISDRASFDQARNSVAPKERVSISNVVIREDCTSDLLLIRYAFGGAGFFVSEKIKNEIEAAGCTGIRFLTGDKDLFA